MAKDYPKEKEKIVPFSIYWIFIWQTKCRSNKIINSIGKITMTMSARSCMQFI